MGLQENITERLTRLCEFAVANQLHRKETMREIDRASSLIFAFVAKEIGKGESAIRADERERLAKLADKKLQVDADWIRAQGEEQ